MADNKVAIIIPCFNEEEILPLTIKKVNSLLEQYIANGLISAESRVYYIDDGSRDKTWSIIKKHAEQNKFIGGISLSRNFGHQNVLVAGLQNIDADIYITIDADLQDNIEAISEMIEKYNEGCDIVCGVRLKRNKDTLFKKYTALLFYSLMKKSGVELIFNHADFRLMSKKAVNALKMFPERNLFLRGMIMKLGFKVACVYYDFAERTAGETKYTLRKMLALAWNGITGFTQLPLKFITVLGMFLLIIGLVLSVFFWSKASISPMLAFSILSFFTGIMLVSLGIVAEYIGQILTETKNRPLFIINETIGL